MVQKGTSKQRVTKKQQEAWLQAYMETGFVTEACKVTGISRRTLYRLLKSSEAFAEARKLADHIINDTIDDEILRRGRDGWDVPVYQGGRLVGQKRAYDAKLLLAAATARMPDKYATRHHVTGRGPVLRSNMQDWRQATNEGRSIPLVMEYV